MYWWPAVCTKNPQDTLTEFLNVQLDTNPRTSCKLRRPRSTTCTTLRSTFFLSFSFVCTSSRHGEINNCLVPMTGLSATKVPDKLHGSRELSKRLAITKSFCCENGNRGLRFRHADHCPGLPTLTGLDPRTDFETVGDRLKKGSLASKGTDCSTSERLASTNRECHWSPTLIGSAIDPSFHTARPAKA